MMMYATRHCTNHMFQEGNLVVQPADPTVGERHPAPGACSPNLGYLTRWASGRGNKRDSIFIFV